jgi:hypothetical protein
MISGEAWGTLPTCDRGLEAELLEERFEQLVAERVLILAAPANLGVPQKIANEGEHFRWVVAPGWVFPQAIAQEVVGEQASVLEIFAGAIARLADRCASQPLANAGPMADNTEGFSEAPVCKVPGDAPCRNNESISCRPSFWRCLLPIRLTATRQVSAVFMGRSTQSAREPFLAGTS